MKSDVPTMLESFIHRASAAGFVQCTNVTEQKLTVIALDSGGEVLRYFSPDLRPTAAGTIVGGYIGIALRNEAKSSPEYDVSVFSHIDNYADLRRSNRIIESGIENFLSDVKATLLRLPSTVAEIETTIDNGDNWIARQMSLDRPFAKAFRNRLASMTDEGGTNGLR